MKNRWSRVTALLLALCVFMSTWTLTAFAEETELAAGTTAENPLTVSGDALVYDEKNGIVGFSKTWYDSLNLNGAALYVCLTIPAEMNGTPFTKIAYQALQYMSNGFRNEPDVLKDGLKNIKIVSVDFSQATNLETIGDFAFDQRPELGGVIDLSNTKVTKIGAGAFRKTGITGVILPDGLVELGDVTSQAGTFADCKQLQYVRAASSKDSAEAVVLPKSLTTIGKQCFRYSFAQTVNMEIPASVATVGAEAFNSQNILQINVLHSGDYTGYDKYAFQRKAGELNIFQNAADYSAAYKQASTAQKCMTYEVSVNFKVNDALLDTQTKLYNQYFLYEKDENGIWSQNEEYRLPSGDMAAGYEYDWKYATNQQSVAADSKVNDGSTELPESIDVVTSGSKLTAPKASIEMPDGSYVHEDGSITLKGVISNKVDSLHYAMVWAVYNQTTDEWDELTGETSDTLTVTEGGNYYLFACEAYDDNEVRSEQEGDYVYVYAAPHQWSYTASGNTVTASCAQTHGFCPYADSDLKLTLTAPDAFASEQPYNKAATMNTITEATKAVESEIYYEGVDGTNYEKTATAPSKAGSYKATVTIGGATAEQNFRIYGTSEAYTVTFETNGGTELAPLVKEKDSKLAEGEAVTTREDYTFGGWYKDSELTDAWNYAEDTVSGNMTLYAKWNPVVYQVSGKVVGRADEDMTGTVVKLMQDGVEIASATADETGAFRFENVVKDSYIVTTEKDGRSAKNDITVAANVENVLLQLPGSIKVEVTVEENTPNTTVDGLDALEKVYQPESADIVHIILKVAGKSEADIPEDATKIKELAGKETLSYLTMDLEHYINGEQQPNITDTAPQLLAITVDYDTANKNISVYRVHNDEAVKLTLAGDEPADGTYRVNDGSITIYATKFSTYAIGYTKKSSGGHTDGGHTSSGTIVRPSKNTGWKLSYRDCPRDRTCPIWPFTDASTTQWYHDGVHFCLENGLMVGYGSNTFRPDAGTTRGMIAVMLWRLNGSPVVNYAMSFDDVKAGAWYTEAIRWAVSEGIAFGYGNGNFGPDDVVTREQMVTILYRYAKSKGYDVSVGENTNILSYDDAFSVAQYAIPAMQWACGSGMVTGQKHAGSMILDPQGSTTRAQMATMMMRFCAEIAK